MLIEKIIDDYLREKEKEKERSNKFRVSGAGQCYLKRIFEVKQVEYSDPPSPRLLRVFEVGNIFHRWLQNLLEEKGLLVGKEIEVEDGWRKGHIDAIIRLDGKLILYDFKTVHSERFHKKEEVDMHYAMQAFTYKLMFEKQFNEQIDSVRILYISKDDLLLKEVLVEKIPNIHEITVSDWIGLINFIKGISDEGAPKNPWECKFCFYKTFCKQKWGGS